MRLLRSQFQERPAGSLFVLSQKGVDALDLARSFRLAPVPVYLIMMGTASLFGMTYGILAAVYRIEEAGLNPLELILIGTVLEASVSRSQPVSSPTYTAGARPSLSAFC